MTKKVIHFVTSCKYNFIGPSAFLDSSVCIVQKCSGYYKGKLVFDLF